MKRLVSFIILSVVCVNMAFPQASTVKNEQGEIIDKYVLKAILLEKGKRTDCKFTLLYNRNRDYTVAALEAGRKSHVIAGLENHFDESPLCYTLVDPAKENCYVIISFHPDVYVTFHDENGNELVATNHTRVEMRRFSDWLKTYLKLADE